MYIISNKYNKLKYNYINSKSWVESFVVNDNERIRIV